MAPFLILRHSVSEDFVVTYAVLVYPTAITGVSLNGINDTVFYFLNNTGVVGLSVLRTGAAYVIPIEENDHSGDRLGRAVNPQTKNYKQQVAVHAARKFRNNPSVEITSLHGTPAYKTSTPFHTASETIPRPVRFAAYIADL